MNSKEFIEWLKTGISASEEGSKSIMIYDNTGVFIKKSFITQENQRKFIRVLVDSVANIQKGMSWVAMTENDSFPLDKNQILVIMGFGKAFGVWEIYPTDMATEGQLEIMMKSQESYMYPTHTGLNVRASLPMEKTVIIDEVDLRGGHNLSSLMDK